MGQKSSSESRSGFSIFRSRPVAAVDAREEEAKKKEKESEREKEEEGSNLNRSFDSGLSQGWSDLGAEAEEMANGEGEGDDQDQDGASSSQRHSWDSVATLRGEGPRVRFFLDDKESSVDDEADGSNTTHVGEGSDGYKDGQEYGPFQERKGIREIRSHTDYSEPLKYARSTEKEYGSLRWPVHEIADTQAKHEDTRGTQRLRDENPRRGDSQRAPRTDAAGLRKEMDDESSRANDARLHEQRRWNDVDEDMPEKAQEAEDDTLPPARVMLMERLCDIVQKLSSVRVGGGMEDDVLEVLNGKVDEMEELLVLAEQTAEAEATAEIEALGRVKDGEEVNLEEDTAVKEEARVEEEGEAEEDVEVKEDSEAKEKTKAKEERDATPDVETPRAKAESRMQMEGKESKEQAQAGSTDDNTKASNTASATHPVPSSRIGDRGMRDLTSPLPWLSSAFKYSELSISPIYPPPELAAATNAALEAAKQAAQAQAEMAERVAREAERLNRELAKVIKRLQARKEESDVSVVFFSLFFSLGVPLTSRHSTFTACLLSVPRQRRCVSWTSRRRYRTWRMTSRRTSRSCGTCGSRSGRSRPCATRRCAQMPSTRNWCAASRTGRPTGFWCATAC